MERCGTERKNRLITYYILYDVESKSRFSLGLKGKNKAKYMLSCIHAPHSEYDTIYIVHMEVCMSESRINYPPDLKERIAKVLSKILSDKYDCKITLRFVPKEGNEPKDK